MEYIRSINSWIWSFFGEPVCKMTIGAEDDHIVSALGWDDSTVVLTSAAGRKFKITIEEM